MKISFVIILAFVWAVQLVIANKCCAAEYFVSSSNGDDAADGLSITTPFKTIRHALEETPAGSTIIVLPGWYLESDLKMKKGEKSSPTVLKALVRGRVFIGKSEILTTSSFVKTPDLHYVYEYDLKGSSASDESVSLNERDNKMALRELPSIQDVEELAGSFYFNREAGKIYVHPSDSAGINHHIYCLIRSGNGIVVDDYTTVSGLCFSGFGGAAIRGVHPTGVLIENCVFYSNGFGVELVGAKNCVIRGNEAWENFPSYEEGAQIYVSGPAYDCLAENNIATDSNRIGLRFYVDLLTNCVARGNQTYRNDKGGFYFKGNDSTCLGERNVSLDNKIYDFGAPLGGNNTATTFARYKTKASDLVVKKSDSWKFADPAHRDYRLQSDSPARRAGPNRSDLGAFPYDGSVRYVSSEGSDEKDGTSLSSAWRTLAHATKALRPGQTLYISGGNWSEPLVLSRLVATTQNPTIIRVYNKARAVFPKVEITGCGYLKVEDLRIHGSKVGGILIEKTHDTELNHCASYGNEGSGISLNSSKNINIDHCAISDQSEYGIKIDEASSDVSITSTVFLKNKKGHLALADKISGFYGEFNAFDVASAPAKMGETTAKDLEAWRQLLQSDHDSIIADPSDYSSLENGDFHVRSNRLAAVSGRYNRAIGPDGLLNERLQSGPAVDHIEVISVTSTSANITYWTPGRVTGTVIEWGPNESYGNQYDRGRAFTHSEYETFHTVSLLGLAPGTTYHYRVGFYDLKAEVPEGGHHPLIWSNDQTFTTARQDPLPRKLYVSLEGNDQNSGLSPDKAWKTLHKASREAHAGDVVTLAPGNYLELLRPLQTGLDENHRITFRAERPLTVFLDGGLRKGDRGNLVPEGRSFCVQLPNKAFMTLENLTMENTCFGDNGGYRDGWGYGRLVDVSGAAGIEIKNCVFDGRARWITALCGYEIGKIPGVPPGVPAFEVSDSVFLFNWSALSVHPLRACVLRNNALVRGLPSMFSELGGEGKIVLRNNILQSLIPKKKKNPIIKKPEMYDSNYNCFAWDFDHPKNEFKLVASDAHGLQEWQRKYKQDMNSIQGEPGYAISKVMGFGTDKFDPDEIVSHQLTVEDFILPDNSICRKSGEKGEDIGPRWDRWK